MSTPIETIENNRLLALFMGWKPQESGYYPINHCDYDIYGNPIQSTIGPYKGEQPLHMYHHSWTWLIPVCQKWDNLFQNETLPYEYIELSVALDEQITLYEITPVYNQLLKNIKWYNEFKAKKK